MQIFTVYVNEIKNRLDPLFYSQDSVNFYKRANFKLEKLNNLTIYFKSGFAAGKQDQDNLNKPIIQLRPTNINEYGFLYFDKNIYLKKEIAEKKQSELLQKGEVLFNNTNSQELVGKTAYFSLLGSHLCSNHITRIMVDKNKILPQYLWVVLNIYQQEKVFFNICTNWNNQSGVNIDLLKTLDIPVPNIETQEQIVKTITTAYEQKQQKEKEAQELFDSINEYVMHELDVKIPEIKNELTYFINSDEIKSNRIDPWYYKPSLKLQLEASRYKIVTFEEICKNITDGDHGNPNYSNNENEGINYLRVTDVKQSEINWNNLLKISSEYSNKLYKNCFAKVNDLLISIVGTIGESILIKKSELPLAVSRGFAILTLNENINHEYILALTKSKIIKIQLEKNKVGSVQKGVYLNSIKNIVIPLPTIGIQAKIAEEVKNRQYQAKNLQKEALGGLAQAKKQVEKMILSNN